MKDEKKTKKQLIDELLELRQRVAELEKLEVKQKRAEKRLKAAANEWRTTFDSATELIMLLDSEMKIIKANLATVNFLNKPFNEILDKTCFQLFHGTEKPPDTCPLVKSQRTKKHEEAELYLPEKHMWIFVTASPIFDDKGNLTGAVHTIKDITKRKRLKETLKKEQQELKLIIDSSPIIVFYKDKEGKFIRVNKTFAEALKMPEEEFVGKTVFDLYSAKIAQGMTDDDQEVLKSGRPKLNIVEQYESSSGIRWVQTDKIPIFDKNGMPVGLIGFAQDITERKQAEQALLESTERYRIIFNNVSDAVFVHGVSPDASDPNRFRIIEVNNNACQYLGYSREELLQMSIVQLDAPETIANVPTILKKLFAEGRATWEGIHMSKDGRRIPVEISIQLFELNGKPMILSAVRGVTERKRAEEALRESEKKYRRIVETANEGIWVSDGEYRTTFVNPRMAEMLGYAPDEMLGRRNDSFIFKDDLEDHASQMKLRVRGEGSVYERRFHRKDGTTLWAIVSGSSISDSQGRFAGAFAMLTDITERKKAEESLKRREQEIRLIAENVPALFSYIDADGCYRFANKQYEAWFGVLQTEIIGKHYRQVLGETTYELIKNSVEAALSGQKVYFEKYLPYVHGGERWVSANYVPDVDELGKVKGFFALVTDITERKQADEKLKKSYTQLHELAAHLQSIREEERTQIARDIHDELSQTLTGLKFDLSWLHNKILRAEGGASLIEKINSMSHILDNSIQWARRISMTLRPSVLDDLGLIAALEWQANEFQTRTGISCIFTSFSESVFLDREESTSLFRICQESLTNVARHSDATAVTINLKEAGVNLILKVSDNGKGITETQITDTKSLGLLGMKERALILNGEFTVSGIPGKGTTVIVKIPRRK